MNASIDDFADDTESNSTDSTEQPTTADDTATTENTEDDEDAVFTVDDVFEPLNEDEWFPPSDDKQRKISELYAFVEDVITSFENDTTIGDSLDIETVRELAEHVVKYNSSWVVVRVPNWLRHKENYAHPWIFADINAETDEGLHVDERLITPHLEYRDSFNQRQTDMGGTGTDTWLPKSECEVYRVSRKKYWGEIRVMADGHGEDQDVWLDPVEDGWTHRTLTDYIKRRVYNKIGARYWEDDGHVATAFIGPPDRSNHYKHRVTEFEKHVEQCGDVIGGKPVTTWVREYDWNGFEDKTVDVGATSRGVAAFVGAVMESDEWALAEVDMDERRIEYESQ